MPALTPGAKEGAVFGVFLDTVIPTIHHQQMLIVINSQTGRPVKLTVTAALPAPFGKKGALLVEDGNALQGIIGDIDILLGVEGNGHRPHDLAVSSATAAKITLILFGQR